MVDVKPQSVTIGGRLSYPVFDYKTAVVRNQKSEYPKADVDKIAPEFNVLIEQEMLDKVVVHVRDEFLPWVLERSEAGEKKNALDKAQIDKLLKQLDAGDWENQPPYIPIKPVPKKTRELAPEAVAMIKVSGTPKVDIKQVAYVRDEDELIIPDAALKLPKLLPIERTIWSDGIQAGWVVAATLNLYAYMNGKVPGYSAGANTIALTGLAESFSGGGGISEDELFGLV